MSWKKNRQIQIYVALYLVILLPPCALMNVILTVNNNTQNHVLTTNPGKQESLKCTVQNNSQQEELRWYREDGMVALKAENKINASVICINVSVDDNEVTFTCKLKRNQSMSISVILNVTYEPILNGIDIQTVEEGSSVKLACNVKSNPPAQMMWYRNNSVLNLEKNHHQIYQTSELFQLSISKVLKSDNGTYRCQASRSMNLATKDFYLIIEDKRITIPIEPIIAASVVVICTLIFGVLARRKKIMKLCTRN